MPANLRSELEGLVGSATSSLARELEGLIERRAVEIVAEHLGLVNGAVPTRKRAKVARKRAPAAAKGDNGARILAHVKAHPGQRSEAVRAALGIKKGAWVYATNALIASKQLKRRGIKRASTLHPA